MSAPTPQQRAAIAARGNVLVAAGAGTGKTSTVAARALDLILGERCPVEQILMVTFTEAAAAEMRERIRTALAETDHPAGPDAANWLAEQTALLDTAPISTLHSFCLELVRRHFHVLGLDPQFSVLDESQSKPLVHATLDRLFLRHYAADSPASATVRELIRTYGNGRDDSIRQLVVQIHHYSQTLPSPARWFAEQTARFANESPAPWRELLVEAVQNWADLWKETLTELAPQSANLAACAAALRSLPAQPALAEAAAILVEVQAADEMKWERGTKTRLRRPIEAFFTSAAFLRELAQTDGAALAEDWAWSRTPMRTLLQLAQEFGADFAQAKRELGGIDFADQEQFALRLLLDDAGQPTSVAQACRARFRFVFVDECQDINAAQDAILRAVSRDGAEANRFLVGDVKQSIYRFRLANPRIFQDYLDRWSGALPAANPDPASGSPLTQALSLTENFRSREGLLAFLNPVFRILMRPVLGGLTYDERAELRFGGKPARVPLSLAAHSERPPEFEAHQWPAADEVAPRGELHVVTKDAGTGEAPDIGANEDDTPDLQTTGREARLIALRLRQLKESGHRVWRGKAGFAPVEYRDMVVLLRGIGQRAEIFAQAFHQAGVPLDADRAGFLDALEVTDLLSLLRLLDNPLQDLPLLAVLRSPFVGLSAEELVQLRVFQRRGLLWEALVQGVTAQAWPATESADSPAPPPALGEKLACFLNQFHRWRELVRHTSLTHCLETALTETHYEALLLAGERGPVRVANVRRLLDLARRFDPYQREGLFRFLQFIGEQETAEVPHKPAGLNHGNTVRLMTIHASKGLEFPVVVLAGLGGRFNQRDLNGDILLHEDLGLCPKVLPPGSRTRYPSIAHWLAAQRERRASLGEELRLLYVAMTRARDTLILTGTAARQNEIARWQEAVPLNNHSLTKAGCFLDWLRLWFANHVKPPEWRNEREGGNQLLRWKFHGADDPIFRSPDLAADITESALPAPSAAELALLRTRLDWRYPHSIATREPAKSSVTALRRRIADETDDEARLMFVPRPAQSRRSRSKLSAAEIGLAHHAFLQFVSLERTASELDLRNEAARLEREGVLAAKAAAALDFPGLLHFWQSDLGAQLRRLPPNVVNREMPFTARFTLEELRRLAPDQAASQGSDLPEDFIVVQGFVDLAVLLPEEIWLVDFKTDEVTEADLSAKVTLYTPQLKIYARALAGIHRRPVTQCWLHFLNAGKSVDLAP